MNLPKAVLLTLVFSISSAAFAEGGADRVFTRVVDAQHVGPGKKLEQQIASDTPKKGENCKECC